MLFPPKLHLPYRNDYFFGSLLLIVFLIPLAFDVYNFESFEIIKFGLLMFLVAVAGLVFVKRYFIQKSSPLVLRMSKTFFLGLCLFLAWALVSSLLAQDKNFSFFGFYPRFTNGFLFYSLWAILFLLVSALDKIQLWLLIKLLFFCAVLTALWGMLQSLGIGYYQGQTFDFFSRASPSFLGNPNFSSMFVATFVPLGVYFLLTAGNFWSKVFYALSVFLQIWSVVAFASRGSVLAAIAGLSACLFFTLVIKKAFNRFALWCALFLGVAFILIFAFLNFSRPGSVAAKINLNETNIQTRFGVWDMTWISIFRKPVFGHGLGNFELVFEQNRDLSSIKSGFFDDPHNLFLYLAVSGGIPFLFLFLFLVFFPLLGSLKQVFAEKNDRSWQNIALLGCVCAWMVAAFFTPVAVPCYVALVFLLSGFVEKSFTYQVPKLAVYKIAGASVFALLLVYSVSFLLAEHLFFASIKAYNRRDYFSSNKLAKAAVYLNPVNNLYYQYIAASSIRAKLPEEEINKNIRAVARFHKARGYSYITLANIYYLRFYETLDPKYKEVILEYVKTAMSLDPHSGSNYFILSQFYFAFADLPNAKAAVTKGLEMDPQNVEAIVFLAKLYQIEGNREMLIKTLWEAAKYDGDKIALINLIKLAKSLPDISQVPFGVGLSLGRVE